MLKSLWDRRRKVPFGRSWGKDWAKRVISLPLVIGSDRRAAALRRRGATVAPDSFLAPCHFGGQLGGVEIGAGTFLGRVRIEAEAAVRIGRCVCINDGAWILTASHDVTDPRWGVVRAPVIVDDSAWIGMRAIILPGVTVGYGAVVGAGAVVSKDVPPFCVAVGNPARIVPGRRSAELDYQPTSFLAPVIAWLGSPGG